MTTDKPSAGELAERCERYAKIIEGIIVVADDWQPGDPERREPRETLLEAAAALRSPAEVGVIKIDEWELAQFLCEDLADETFDEVSRNAYLADAKAIIEFCSALSPPVAERGGPLMPAKLTGELACIIECCDPPEHQTDEAVERLIFDYQPMWDRLRAAVAVRGGGGAPDPDIFAIHAALKVANIEYAAYSCNGVNLVGNGKSIKAAMSAFHSHAQIDQFRTEIRHWREECGKLHAKLASATPTPETGDGSDTRPERGYPRPDASWADTGLSEGSPRPEKVCLYSDGCPMDGPVCHLCAHVQPSGGQ